jgi:hypothetical protein
MSDQNKPMTPVKRNEHGYIVNATELSWHEVVGQMVLCPACNQPLKHWPFGWDEHAAKVCSGVQLADEAARKQEFRIRFRHLFRPD